MQASHPSDSFGFKLEILTLNRYNFGSTRFIDNRDLYLSMMNRAEIQKREEECGRLMRYSLSAFLFGKTLEAFTVQYPANWFEAWKENAYRRGHLGPWAQRRWPVKYERHTNNAIQAFPEFVPENYMGQRSVIMLHPEY